MLTALSKKIWNLLLPYLENYLPKLIDNRLDIKLEKFKSDLKQQEQQNEASNKAIGFLQAIEEISSKNYPIEVLSTSIKSVFTTLSDNEIQNAIKTFQKAKIICDKQNINWETDIENNDWLREFIRLSGKFSADDAHNLWGHILTQEIKESGSISFRAMNTIANLTPKECQDFINLFPYIIDDRHIFAERAIYTSCGLNQHFQTLFELEDTGIIKHVSSPVTISIQTTKTQGKEGVSFRTASNTLTIVKHYEIKINNKGSKIFDSPLFNQKIRTIDLTSVGREIFIALKSIIDYKDPQFISYSSQYLKSIAEHFNKNMGKIDIEIIDRDNDSYYRQYK